MTPSALKRLAVLGLSLVAAGIVSYVMMIRMPGTSHRGPLPPLTAEQAALADELRQDVEAIAGDIGPRHVFSPRELADAASYLQTALRDAGYAVERQTFDVSDVACANLVVEVAGAAAADEIVVVGAHYDTVEGSPGANDNTSGVAATLALARRFAGTAPDRTLRFVLFVNEEPPFFQTADMGSVRYARRCRDRGERVVGMLSLETIGCYSDEPGSQRYPFPMGLVYPSTGNFIGFVGNVGSRRLVRRCVGT
ncbi:MAG: M28 family peptidase, partial [Planctomycetota bacterium]